MAKNGRLYVPLDVNWYDEWGYAVSQRAALLWIIALTACKRLDNDGMLTRAQIGRLAPRDMAPEVVDELIDELIECDEAPVSGDGQAIIMHGWSEWNMSSAAASKSGGFGNHIRWHKSVGKPSADCRFCVDDNVEVAEASPPDRPPIALPDRTGESHPDRTTRSLSRVEKSREEDNDRSGATPFESDFDACWDIYPRKVARKAALKAYVAQRRKGTTADTLIAATRHYAAAMKQEQRQLERILHPSTFFGPDDRWEDYVEAPKREAIASGAGALRLDEYAAEMGERVLLPGEEA